LIWCKGIHSEFPLPFNFQSKTDIDAVQELNLILSRKQNCLMCEEQSMINDELFRLNAKSRFNEFDISRSEQHGCFCCCKIYKTIDALVDMQWSDRKSADEKHARTAVGVSCCVDSLLALDESEKIALEKLIEMNEFWFGEPDLAIFIEFRDSYY